MLEAKLSALRRKNREKERVLEQFEQSKSPNFWKKHTRIKSDLLRQDLPSETSSRRAPKEDAEYGAERRGELTPLFRKKNSESRRPATPSVRSSRALNLGSLAENSRAGPLLRKKLQAASTRESGENSFPLHLDSITSLTIQDNTLLSTSYDGTYKLWDLKKASSKGLRNLSPMSVERPPWAQVGVTHTLSSCVAGQRFLVGDVAGQVSAHFLGARELETCVRISRSPLYDLCFSEESELILAVDAGKLQLFPAPHGELSVVRLTENIVINHARFVCGVFLSGSRLVAGIKSCNALKIFDFEKMINLSEINEKKPLIASAHQTNKLCFKPETGAVYSVHEDGVLRVADPRSSGFVAEHSMSSFPLNGLHVNGSVVMTVGVDSTLRAFNIRAGRIFGERKLQYSKFDCGLMCLTYSDHLDAVLVGGSDGMLKVIKEF